MKTLLYARLFAVLGLGGIGCAAPVMEEESAQKEDVATQSEALYGGPDFTVGLTLVKYANGKTIKSQTVTTQPFSQAILNGAQTGFGEVATGWAHLPAPYTHPDGARVTLTRTANASFGLFATDFRITLQAMNDIHVGTRPGPVVHSPWVSSPDADQFQDLMSLPAEDGVDNKFAEAYSIGIETRPWPTDRVGWLVNFDIAIAAINFDDRRIGQVTRTARSGIIENGVPSTSPTAVTANGGPMDSLEVALNMDFAPQ